MNAEMPALPHTAAPRHGLGIFGRDEVTLLFGRCARVRLGVVFLVQSHPHTGAVPDDGATHWACAGAGIR